MPYAKVVLGIPVEGPFDYIVPQPFIEKIKAGCRVWVNFGNKKMLGYVTGIKNKTEIKNLKSIIEVIDESPILDEKMLKLTKEISDYYCCSWGEAIDTALPLALRQGKKIEEDLGSKVIKKDSIHEITLVHDFDGRKRWEVYLSGIKDSISRNNSVIIILPDIASVLEAKKIIEMSISSSIGVFYRKQPNELQEWVRIKTGKVNIVVGTRSSIFAPVLNLGLIILDEEEESVYKQEQVPHYNVRDVAFMRSKIEKSKVILGSSSPSLEMFYLADKAKIKYLQLERVCAYPEIKIIDVRSEYSRIRKANIVLSKYLEDAIFSNLNAKGKTLLFLNRRGFATFATCIACGIHLKCPRCDISLAYHFKEDALCCHRCNYKIASPKICPHCNSGYIKFSGIGTEKIESELSRVFPGARIKISDSTKITDIKETDIFVSTSSVIKKKDYSFDLVGVLAIDDSLNRMDLRAGEKTFALLSGLMALSAKKMIIQTSLANHHCFNALLKKDSGVFYREELKQRKQLSFPPYRHIIFIKLRGKNEDKVKESAQAFFENTAKYPLNKSFKFLTVNPGYPPKLRGNFYWQIMVSSNNVKSCIEILKIHLKKFSHSGIIVTVDVDPL